MHIPTFFCSYIRDIFTPQLLELKLKKLLVVSRNVLLNIIIMVCLSMFDFRFFRLMLKFIGSNSSIKAIRRGFMR